MTSARFTRVGVNLLPYQLGRQGGAEVYVRNLIEHLAADSDEVQLVLFVTREAKGTYSRNDRCREVVIPVPLRSRVGRIASEQLLLPFYVARHGVVWLLSNYVSPVAAPCRHVVTVHDMLYRDHPAFVEPAKRFYWSKLIPRTLKRASVVLTVSHFSASRIFYHFPEIRPKVRVTVEGVDSTLTGARDEPLDFSASLAPYVMSVASFAPHKNLVVLFEAFRILASSYPNLKLVLVGEAKTPEARKELEKLRSLLGEDSILSRIVFTGHLSAGALATLYRNARMFVFPSKYEGFGLPAIEAQYFRCPLICSDSASLPEIAGEGALFFKSSDAQGLAEAMKTILDDSVARKRIVERGFDNLAKFSWEKAAQDVIDVVRVHDRHQHAAH